MLAYTYSPVQCFQTTSQKQYVHVKQSKTDEHFEKDENKQIDLFDQATSICSDTISAYNGAFFSFAGSRNYPSS